MKRIKQVLWERRIAHLQAKKILEIEIYKSKQEPTNQTSPLLAALPHVQRSKGWHPVRPLPKLKATVGQEAEDEQIQWIGRKRPVKREMKSLTRAKVHRKTSWTVV